ncbi:hypothetical protein P26059A_0041 [Curvibacter phage P26059A]|nr:hypothetical protein P26059A_0041 [Curvibacter phage P26059A]
MSEVKSLYVNELNGRKIIFIKRDDSVIGDPNQCKHCIMLHAPDCSPLVDDSGELMCERDEESVWQYAPEEPSVKSPEPSTGRKFDSGKPMYALLPTNALEEVVKVLTVGAVRYNEPIGQENWRLVPDADFRYYNATQRHIMAVKKGERLDLDKDDSKGTNCYHLACAITSLMFRLQTQIEEDIANGTYDENLWKKALH